jgi:hypothetical protein
MSLNEPANLPAGVMRALHQFEAGAYDPALNDHAGDEIAWADQPTAPLARRRHDTIGNVALIVAIILAGMMLVGFFAAIASGRVH